MILETDRLILRRLTGDDLSELVTIQADPELVRFLGRFDEAAMASWLADVDASWAERGYGRLGLVERDTGRLVGRSGIMFVDQFDAPELGWTLRREAWGHGYATEAARACLDWGFNALGMTRIISLIERTNERSLHVAKRLGMTPGEHATWLERPMIVHAMTRAAWEATSGGGAPGPASGPEGGASGKVRP